MNCLTDLQAPTRMLGSFALIAALASSLRRSLTARQCSWRATTARSRLQTRLGTATSASSTVRSVHTFCSTRTRRGRAHRRDLLRHPATLFSNETVHTCQHACRERGERSKVLANHTSREDTDGLLHPLSHPPLVEDGASHQYFSSTFVMDRCA